MQLLIIAGGKGTRLGYEDIPKPMVKIGPKPNIELQVELAKRFGIKDIFVLSGYLADQIYEYLGDGSKYGVNITHIVEPYPLGTAGSIKLVEHVLKDRFMVFYGDIVMDFDIDSFIEFDKKNDSLATIFTHPNDHPYDSDLIEVDFNDRVIEFYSKPHKEGIYYKNLVNAAIYILSKQIFNYIEFGVQQDFGKDVFPKAVKSGELIYCYKSAEYVKDMGTKERLLSVTNDFLNNKVQKMNKKNPQKAVFLDRDGVINKYIDNLSTIEDFELYDGVTDAIKKINLSDYLCIVVSNQPMIAKGFLNINDLNLMHNKMDTMLGKAGAYLTDIYFCPHHPDKGFEGELPELKIDCECRKPNIGMIQQAVAKYNIDLANSFMIGDTTVDIMTGQKAGLKTVLVKTGVGGLDGKYNVLPDYLCDDLQEAVDIILNKEVH